MQKIGIIGAGPAGIFASLEAKKTGAEVFLIDANNIVGRKLLVTGAGRCNLTNTHVSSEKYHAHPISTVDLVLQQFSHADLLDYLNKLGILTQATPDGWVYPLSYSAANVASIFTAQLLEAGVSLRLAHKVKDIIPQKQGFLLIFSTPHSALFVNNIVISTGGKAYPSLGSDGSIFPALQELGHEISPVHPALAPLVVSQKAVSSIQGVRLDAGIRLFDNRKLLGETFGNIIFTKGGINGPGVMDLSYLVNRQKNSDLAVDINFIAGHEASLKELFTRFTDSSILASTLLGAVVPSKIASFILKSINIKPDKSLSNLSNKERNRIMENLTAFSLKVEGVRGFDFCQLSTGGIAMSDVDPHSLESIIYPGMYFAGEILDVHGPCGGYNLQWAFSSGIVAGRHAALMTA